MRKEGNDTNVYEEAFLLIRNAPFVSFEMTKMRLEYLDKIEHWDIRKEGTIGESKSKEDHKTSFESNILTFERYFIEKVTPIS